jgi:hypothetical protein
LQSSATKIAASTYNVHSLVREKFPGGLLSQGKKEWRLWIAMLQYKKQLFSLRFPQMKKYCGMRECDNIHSWISLSGEFMVLNSPKSLWRSLAEISLVVNRNLLKT